VTRLVIALHGSPHPGAAAFADELRGVVAGRLDGAEVETAWVDARVRTLSSAQTQGAIVVPAFLTSGYHVGVDIPDAASEAVVTGHVGPLLLDAVADRVREAGGAGDAILLAAAGSKRAEALNEVERVANHLCWAFGVPVRVGYLYGDGATVEDRAAELAADGFRDVSVATYFLAPGLYAERLDALPVARVGAPIGVHPGLVEAVAGLYREAVERAEHEQSPLNGRIAGIQTKFAAEPALVEFAGPYLAGLHLAGRRVLVAGAGAVASRRVPALLDAGAHVLVVAPEASEVIAGLAAAGRLTWVPRPVEAADLDGAWFVLAATSDPDANALVGAASEERRVFCVRADAGEWGTARTPATGTVDGLTVGVVSTVGRAPRLVAEARDVAVDALGAWASPKKGAA
jgi:sirohydrochlorin cobaltochelatase